MSATKTDASASANVSPQSQFFAEDEVLRKLTNLTVQESAKIASYARVQSLKTKGRMSADDLYNEAFTRVLSLERKWRRDYSAVQFLTGDNGVIKSIATHEKEKGEREKGSEPFDESGFPEKQQNGAGVRPHANPLDAQQLLNGIHLLDVIAEELKDDPFAFRVFNMAALGCEADEIMEELGISKTQLDSKRRLIQRRMERRRLNGDLK